MTSDLLYILLLEDSPTDAELNERELRKGGFEFKSLRVDTRDTFIRALEEFRPDIVLADFNVPEFDGKAALQIVRREHPEIPFVIVTGALADIEAVELLHAGARDYVLKDRPARLAAAVRRALSIERVIHARKAAEHELRESEEKFRAIFENAKDGIVLTDAESGLVADCNPEFERQCGRPLAQIKTLHVWELRPPEQQEAAHRKFEEIKSTGHGSVNLGFQRPDGAFMPTEVIATRVRIGDHSYIVSVSRDITEHKQFEEKILAAQAELQRLLDTSNQSRRAMLSVIEDLKRAEDSIQHSNRALTALSAANRALVRTTNENELLQAICDAIVKQKGYRMSWVGYVQHDESKSINIMAHAGQDEGYLDTAEISRGETGRAVRSGVMQLCQDIASDPHYSPWREAALKCGYAASIALPLINDEVFGILHVYSGETNAFTPTEIALLEEMAGDLAFGVRSLHTRHERDLAQDKIQQQLVQLQASLEDTMRAIASIVEMRDPYTAGHQVRVADLAAAIAKQMGLPDEQVHAIHLAGTVHDLGKIQIPSEILSKPGRITDLEFRLIKVHPQAGYDILKGISFPWPIAQMVLQHHERMDGSGYPQGLKGDAILLEARILSVADVVEAISAHRPYRAGLGVEVALGEITKNRGIFYDPQVVDACLAVFNEQHYSFKS